MNLKRILTATAISAIALTACQPTPLMPRPPAEDDADFDCLRHGNGICGPITARFNGDGTVTFSSDANGVIATTARFIEYPQFGTVCRDDADANSNICANPLRGGTIIR